MSGPNVYIAEKSYAVGEDIIWVINKTGGQVMPNGVYNYEITQSHRNTQRQVTPINLEGRTSNIDCESGTLTVLAEKWVSPKLNKATADETKKS